MVFIKKLICILMAASLFCCMFTGCSGKNSVRTAITCDSMGVTFAHMVDTAEKNRQSKDYSGVDFEFTTVDTYEDAKQQLLDGKVDVIAVTTDVASRMYNEQNGDVVMLAVISYAPLYIIDSGETITDISDLRATTIYAKNKGSMNDCILQYVFKGNRLDPKINVTVEYFDTNAQVSENFYSINGGYAYVADPAASTIINMSEFSRAAIDINAEWDSLYPDTPITYGCLVASKKFADKNVDAIEEFLAAYEQSAEKMHENYKTTADICKEYGIVPGLSLGLSLIEKSKPAFITGDQMQTKVLEFLNMIYDIEPTAIGFSVPKEDFFYKSGK